MQNKRSNGNHCIYFDKQSNRYRGQIILGIDESGKKIRKSVCGATEQEVESKLRDIEYSTHARNATSLRQPTFFQLAKQLLDDDLDLNYVKEATYLRNIETLKQLKELHPIPLKSLTQEQIKNVLSHNLHYSQGVIDKQYGMISRVLAAAVNRNIINKNPMAEIRKPKSRVIPEKVRALTIEEQRDLTQVLTTTPVNYRYQMLLSLFTGMRMGEINALQPSDISLKNGIISISKTISHDKTGATVLSPMPKTKAGNRKIPITDDVRKILQICIYSSSGKMLFSHKGALVTTSQVYLQFLRMLKKHHIIDPTVQGKVNLHSLRHTYATRCIESGMQPTALQHLLGHTNISTTLNTYCDAFDQYKEQNLLIANTYLRTMGLTLDAQSCISNTR